ncbi:hypothetical protein E4T44_00166 [Aureobasidium sp. EXF-8845]|nr:hypothetical protein E4T44_00166 [Aureobasidium sp. EXF-8845]KAI4858294.1 hypothetical protein E4T45_00199 [Aureobasidium sp. EXF-8846]
MLFSGSKPYVRTSNAFKRLERARVTPLFVDAINISALDPHSYPKDLPFIGPNKPGGTPLNH